MSLFVVFVCPNDFEGLSVSVVIPPPQLCGQPSVVALREGGREEERERGREGGRKRERKRGGGREEGREGGREREKEGGREESMEKGRMEREEGNGSNRGCCTQ